MWTKTYRVYKHEDVSAEYWQTSVALTLIAYCHKNGDIIEFETEEAALQCAAGEWHHSVVVLPFYTYQQPK